MFMWCVYCCLFGVCGVLIVGYGWLFAGWLRWFSVLLIGGIDVAYCLLVGCYL